MIDIAELTAGIRPLNETAKKQARNHFDDLIKPKGSLAKLEDMVCLYAAATGVSSPTEIDYPRRAILLLVNERDEVFLNNISAGKEPILFLAEKANSDVLISKLSCQKPGMSDEMLIDALLSGIDNAHRLITENQYKLLSVAVPGEYVLPKDWENLKDADAYEVLLALSDVRMAAAVGTILSAAYLRIPIMLDGLASVIAAFLASKLAPTAIEYCIASHITTEDGQEELLKELGLSAVLRLKISQGQGEGAAIAFNLFDAGIRAYKEMETFAQAGVHVEVEEFSQTKQN